VSEASVDILMTLSGGGGAGPKLFCSRVSVRSKSSRFLKFALNGQCTTKYARMELLIGFAIQYKENRLSLSYV
jgi:hypothetical protein